MSRIVLLCCCSCLLAAATLSERMVADLRDDQLRWNALEAERYLSWRAGDWVIPLLEAALESSDWQQRQLAAAILQRRDDSRVSEALIRVSIEGLRDDQSVFGPDVNLLLCNARNGFHWLLDCYPACASQLEQALLSDDAQQRFLAACVLGARGHASHGRRICAILIPHLSDNLLPGDGLYAAAGIAGLGSEALPWLEWEYARAYDQQAREALLALIAFSRGQDERLRITGLSRWRRDLKHVPRWQPMFWGHFNAQAPPPLVFPDDVLSADN